MKTPLERCQCEQCQSRREALGENLSYMEGGLGTHKRVMDRHLKSMPPIFVNHMRKMLRRLNKQDPKTNHIPNSFIDLCKTYRRELKQFVRPSGKELVVKRHFQNKKQSLASALGQMYNTNPNLFNQVINDMNLHD